VPGGAVQGVVAAVVVVVVAAAAAAAVVVAVAVVVVVVEAVAAVDRMTLCSIFILWKLFNPEFFPQSAAAACPPYCTP